MRHEERWELLNLQDSLIFVCNWLLTSNLLASFPETLKKNMLWGPRWLPLLPSSALTSHTSAMPPLLASLPWHSPGSSAASLLIVLSLKPDVWIFHTEYSLFPAMAIKVLVIQCSAQRPLCSWRLSRSSPYSSQLSFLLLDYAVGRTRWLDLVQVLPICLPEEWYGWVSSEKVGQRTPNSHETV